MKKHFLTICIASIFLFSANQSFSQGFKDKYFWGLGFSVYTDFIITPSDYEITKGNNSYNTYIDTSIVSASASISLFTFTFVNRITLKEISDNSSIGLDFPVSLGLHFGGEHSIAAQLPLMLSYNFGNVSTYAADKNKGIGIGLGVELTKFLLNGDLGDDGSQEYIRQTPSFFAVPAASIAYRYWNKRNKARELNLKIGYLPGSPKTININSQDEIINTGYLSLKLSFIIYPKY